MNQADIDALTSGAGHAQRAPDLAELGTGVTSGSEVPLAMLMDLTLPLSIELGRTRMTVQDILRLGRGSVVQLERLAGEPIDLYVADRRFAEGEVVVLGEHFGVRITRIISNLALPEGNA
jgi:flagellar motor switch protein FliN